MLLATAGAGASWAAGSDPPRWTVELEADYSFDDRWHFLIDLDALAGGPGRAIDLALKIGYDLSDDWRLTAGYRTIEGGADVDEVYNFAWFHSAVLSAVYRF